MKQTKLNKEAKLEFTFMKVAEHERILKEHDIMIDGDYSMLKQHDEVLKQMAKIIGLDIALITKEKVNHFQIEASQDKVGDNSSPGGPIIIQEMRE